MTREEAIGRIQEHIHIHSKKEPFTPYLDEAFDMAIEALKTHDDLCDNLAWYINERNRLLKEQRPHGEWRGSTERRNMVTRICTSCGDRSVVGYFCMWCGADMRTKESGEKE